MRETAPAKQNKNSQSKPNPPPKPNTRHTYKIKPHPPRQDCRNPANNRQNSLGNLINGFLPPNLYNKKTKKLFGLIDAEDLLLIALILLFSENDEGNDPLVVIALIYILLSEYIDIPQLL